MVFLFLFACNKVNKNVEQVETPIDTTEVVLEDTLLSEEECWKLFDEFWVEFQRAVIEDDTNKLKKMSKLSKKRFNTFLKFLHNYPSFKIFVTYIHKGDRLSEGRDGGNDVGYEGGIQFGDECVATLTVYFHTRSLNGGTSCAGRFDFDFGLVNNKYKLIDFEHGY